RIVRVPAPSLTVSSTASTQRPPEYFWTTSVAAGTGVPPFVYVARIVVEPPGATVEGATVAVTAGDPEAITTRDGAGAPTAACGKKPTDTTTASSTARTRRGAAVRVPAVLISRT